MVVAWLVLSYTDEVFYSGSRYSSRYADSVDFDDEPSGGDTARVVIGIVLAVVVLAVVTVERWSLWKLLTTRFKRFARQADSGGSLTGLFTEDFREQLARYRQEDESAGAPGAPWWCTAATTRSWAPGSGATPGPWRSRWNGSKTPKAGRSSPPRRCTTGSARRSRTSATRARSRRTTGSAG